MSNIKTAVGCESNSCNIEVRLKGGLCIANNSTAFKDGLGNCIK